MGLRRRGGRSGRRGGDAAADRGDDGFGGGDVRIVGPASASPDASGDGVAPDGAVLDELSSAFGVDVDAPDEGWDDTDDVVPAPSWMDDSDPVLVDGGGGDGRAEEPVAMSSGTTFSIGGDDDLPDAVYLDEADALGGESTVFIDDDGQGDAILPKDATGPGIEPRLRQRRIGVRRAEGRRRLMWAGIVLLVVILVVAGLAVLGSGLFSIDDVSVSGRQYADAEEVQEVVDDLLGTPTLLVDVADAERRLEGIAWVAEARVRTDFPDRATIELRERVPLATVRGVDERYRIIDREGRVLAIETGQPVAPVLITGPGTLDLEVGQFADVGYAAAANLVTKLTPEVRSRLVSMSVTADGSDMRLVLRNERIDGTEAPDIEVRLGAAIGDNDQLERLVRLERVLDDVDGGDTTIIDVSTEETTEQ